METNRYHHKYPGTFDVVLSLIPDVTESDIFLFLAVIIQMERDIQERLTDYWVTVEHFCTLFCSNAVNQD
jgi:hypothetical protein